MRMKEQKKSKVHTATANTKAKSAANEWSHLIRGDREEKKKKRRHTFDCWKPHETTQTVVNMGGLFKKIGKWVPE